MLEQESFMKIGKIMHRDVLVIGPEESLQNAAAMMKRLDEKERGRMPRFTTS